MRIVTLILFVLSITTAAPARAALYSVGLDKDEYTSDFMIGSVVVSIIFPESNGGVDPNIENWTEERQSQVISEIMKGHQWWADQNPNSSLSFTYVTETIDTKYEPITRGYYGEALWIPDVLGKKGYVGTQFTTTRDYVNDLRQQYNTDWGFVVYVVDSLMDGNGKFADGYFAYAYLGGPFMVMTYDNNGYGIDNMDVVAAHETGHVFHALDEYAGASSPNDFSYGYFVTLNGNHAYSPIADEPDSIMRGGLRWGLSKYTRQMIGWRDSDNNGRDDIVDQSPSIGTLSNVTSNSVDPIFTGDARLNVVPRQNNSHGHGLTVDTIARVEYRVGQDEWVEAQPMDGRFDSAEEQFQVVVNVAALQAQSVTAQDVDIRVVTAYSLSSGGDTSSPTAVSADLANAHVFPNPFKPNSGLGHVNVTFTGLTAGAKVQVFTAAGEPVFEQVADTTSGVLSWAAVNDTGSKISSGVYFYLITDDQGRKKKGKIAVIR